MEARFYKLTKLLFFIVCFCIYNNALGNQKLPVTEQITVFVTDRQGHALSNVSVTESLTGKSYQTDENGSFTCDPHSERRFFYAYDNKLKLVNWKVLTPDQKRLMMQLTPAKTLSGKIVDSEGKPVSNVQIAALPMIDSYVFSDDQGVFDIGWLPDWAGDLENYYLMARHLGYNLAGGIEFTKDTHSVEIKLEPALTLTGVVQDFNGVSIQNAKIGISLRKSPWTCGTPVKSVKSDNHGRYEFHVLPPQQIYGIGVEADGFGRASLRVDTNQIPGELINVEPLVLKIANMSVSGTVLDIDGNPVENADVYCTGSNQPNHHVKSDKEGKFILDKICSGEIRVYANKQQRTQLLGSVETESGTEDLKIVVFETGSSKSSSPPEPVSLTGKFLPDLEKMLDDFKPEMIQGKNVLICFWDYNQRPSRNGILELSKKAKELKEKNIEVIAIQTSNIEQEYLDKWLKENSIDFLVGMIKENQEQTRFNWGVKALPWLILTDKEHVVRAEGLLINELDEKLVH